MTTPYFIDRQELAQVGFSPRGVRQFEDLQQQVASSTETVTANQEATDKLADGTFVTLSPNAELSNERVLRLGDGLKFDTSTAGEVAIRLNGVPFTGTGFRINLVTAGDTEIALPLTGFLATRENTEELSNKTLRAPLLSGLVDAADDAAAATARVPVGGIYRTGSDLKVRVA